MFCERFRFLFSSTSGISFPNVLQNLHAALIGFDDSISLAVISMLHSKSHLCLKVSLPHLIDISLNRAKKMHGGEQPLLNRATAPITHAGWCGGTILVRQTTNNLGTCSKTTPAQYCFLPVFMYLYRNLPY